MIKEVIIVEGKADIAKIRQSVEADVVATEGFNLRSEVLSEIEFAYKQRGIIIMTDPDSAGERIRTFLSQRFPDAKHAFVPREDAMANGDIGIEQASPQAIRDALDKVRMTHGYTLKTTFTMADLIIQGLNGSLTAQKRRADVGTILGIGYCNAKQFLRRLNHYDVTREEWNAAIRKINEGPSHE